MGYYTGHHTEKRIVSFVMSVYQCIQQFRSEFYINYFELTSYYKTDFYVGPKGGLQNHYMSMIGTLLIWVMQLKYLVMGTQEENSSII